MEASIFTTKPFMSMEGRISTPFLMIFGNLAYKAINSKR
jgi:hypothetical protein